MELQPLAPSPIFLMFSSHARPNSICSSTFRNKFTIVRVFLLSVHICISESRSTRIQFALFEHLSNKPSPISFYLKLLWQPFLKLLLILRNSQVQYWGQGLKGFLFLTYKNCWAATRITSTVDIYTTELFMFRSRSQITVERKLPILWL